VCLEFPTGDEWCQRAEYGTEGDCPQLNYRTTMVAIELANMANARVRSATEGSPAVPVLCHAGRELVLAAGVYTIGRSLHCQLVIDDEVVSRKHACLEVTPDLEVYVRDLNSRNGVFVDGRFIGKERIRLAHADELTIGKDTFNLFFDRPRMESGTAQIAETISHTSHRIIKSARTVIAERTEAADNHLEALCEAAQSAIAVDRPREAENLLANHIRAALLDVRGPRSTSHFVRYLAFQWALRLAEATRKDEWFVTAVELLLGQNVVCTREQLLELSRVHKLLGRGHEPLLKQYAALVRAKPSTIDNLRVATTLEEMCGVP
jgi:pSer/pThr/pTyr-binding forkhead associated (FHA) protein